MIKKTETQKNKKQKTKTSKDIISPQVYLSRCTQATQDQPRPNRKHPHALRQQQPTMLKCIIEKTEKFLTSIQLVSSATDQPWKMLLGLLGVIGGDQDVGIGGLQCAIVGGDQDIGICFLGALFGASVVGGHQDIGISSLQASVISGDQNVVIGFQSASLDIIIMTCLQRLTGDYSNVLARGPVPKKSSQYHIPARGTAAAMPAAPMRDAAMIWLKCIMG